MKRKINYSLLAQWDLSEIWSYISHDLNNYAAAVRITDSIKRAIERLPQFPELGASLNAVSTTESNYRYLVCGKYIIIYLFSEDEIIIERIFYGKRDYLKELFNENSLGGE